LRITLLLTITLLGGIAGFFIGGYSYDFLHPTKPPPRLSVSRNSGDQIRSLQAAQPGVTEALDRHQGRYNWFVVGALAGSALCFLG